MRNFFLIAFLLMSSSTFAFATAQAPDVLIYDNKILDLFSNPLESYYKDEKDKPKFYIYPNETSSGNWRGYVAIWEITDGELFLRGLDSWLCDSGTETVPPLCRKADLKELFGNKSVKGKISATWFTGELRIPEGKQIAYVHMGYGSIYERDIIINVEAGKITGQKIIDNTKKELPANQELQKQELEKLKKIPSSNKSIVPKKNI